MMNFIMAGSYSEASGSQVSIGEKLVQTAVRVLLESCHTDAVSVIDLACGPGVLTKRLVDELENKGLDVGSVSVLDYDASMLKQAKQSLPNCHAYEQDFYTPLPDSRTFDIVFSNEGLHWIAIDSELIPQLQGDTPPLLKASFGKTFQAWGDALLVKSLSNLRRMTKTNGVAVLQFGREGQLDALWNVVEEILVELGVSSAFNGALFPLYYPDETSLFQCVRKSGYTVVEAHCFQEDLSEETAADIVSFFKGFSDPRLREILPSESVDIFYGMMHAKIESIGVQSFRKNQWRRSILVLGISK